MFQVIPNERKNLKISFTGGGNPAAAGVEKAVRPPKRQRLARRERGRAGGQNQEPRELRRTPGNRSRDPPRAASRVRGRSMAGSSRPRGPGRVRALQARSPARPPQPRAPPPPRSHHVRSPKDRGSPEHGESGPARLRTRARRPARSPTPCPDGDARPEGPRRPQDLAGRSPA